MELRLREVVLGEDGGALHHDPLVVARKIVGNRERCELTNTLSVIGQASVEQRARQHDQIETWSPDHDRHDTSASR